MSSQNTTTSSGSKYTPDKSMEQEAIECLQSAAASKGEPLSKIAYNEWRNNQDTITISAATITSRLDKNWAAACDEANVTPTGYAESYEHDIYARLLEGIKKAAKEVGEPLSYEKYKSWAKQHDDYYPPPCNIHITRKIDSYTDACSQVNVDTPVGTEYDEDDIIKAIKKANNEIEGAITEKKYKQWKQNANTKYPAINTIKRRTGKRLLGKCNELGIDAKEGIDRKKKYNKDDIIEAIQTAYAELDYDKLTEELYLSWVTDQNTDHPNPSTIRKRKIGPFTNACDIADVPHNNPNGTSPPTKTSNNTESVSN